MKLRFAAGVVTLAVMTGQVLPVAAAQAKPESKSVLPFIEDDYAKALAVATASKKPIFVDVWAPW